MTYGEILIGLGYQLVDKGRYWQTAAIYRGGDSLKSVQIYKDSGVWRDFVAGSGPKPFSALLKATLGTDDISNINIDKSEILKKKIF